MTTYTLAIGADMLLATVPDGADIGLAIAAEAAGGNWDVDDIEYKTTAGCILTDEPPEEEAVVVWRSGNSGWITDETGRDWRFAVRAGA